MDSSRISDSGLSGAARDVLTERRRQSESEGWTAKHDDAHDARELARAALCYVDHYVARQWVIGSDHDDYAQEPMPDNWPWDERWWKPKDARRDLVRAAALIVAEIERLDRESKAAT